MNQVKLKCNIAILSIVVGFVADGLPAIRIAQIWIRIRKATVIGERGHSVIWLKVLLRHRCVMHGRCKHVRWYLVTEIMMIARRWWRRKRWQNVVARRWWTDGGVIVLQQIVSVIIQIVFYRQRTQILQ